MKKHCYLTPQQNGIVDRTNKTLIERMRAMLKTVEIPKTF